MIKGHKINFKSTDTGMFRASFVNMLSAAEVPHFVADVSLKIANSNKSLSDISLILSDWLFVLLICFQVETN